MKTLPLLFAASLALTGCMNRLPTTPINAQTLVGSWYGENQMGGESTIWLTKRAKDGTFTTQFRKCQDGESIFFQEKRGQWQIQGQDYTSITLELSDGIQTWQPATPNRQFVETYTYDQLVKNTLTYYDQNSSFAAFKVANDYALVCPTN